MFILDVREPHEYQICNLKGHLIPLGELPRRVHELDSSHEIVAYCRSGKRSAEAVDFLRKAGFRKVLNLRGGILSWSTEVDSSVPCYQQMSCKDSREGTTSIVPKSFGKSGLWPLR